MSVRAFRMTPHGWEEYRVQKKEGDPPKLAWRYEREVPIQVQQLYEREGYTTIAFDQPWTSSVPPLVYPIVEVTQ